jgi:hypothetical protein
MLGAGRQASHSMSRLAIPLFLAIVPYRGYYFRVLCSSPPRPVHLRAKAGDALSGSVLFHIVTVTAG